MSLPAPPPPALAPHCYRHPDREAGRSCTRCGKPACSDCLQQASVGSHCLDCIKAAQPDLKTKVRYAAAKQRTPVTLAIIAINVAIFLWMVTKSSGVLGGSDISREQINLGLNRQAIHFNREWYRVITSGFVHFGIIHIGFNMFILWQLGQMLERVLGPVKFAMLYLAGLLGGSAGVLILAGSNDRGIAGGASGAVFGLMAAAAVAYHQQGINIMQTGVGRTLVMNLALTFIIPHISIGGHLGGLVAGGLCALVMLAPKWKSFPTWASYATPVVVALASFGICYMVAN